ncbi:MAG TPA: hypothetical protein VKQ28_16710 [Candidatus Acidoferrum sp.]|nr:hypothetical protein [Candidatus Acidoferrum sp.]
MRKIIAFAALLVCGHGARANTPPTLVSYTETAWNTTAASKATATVSWNSGDIITVIGGAESSLTLGVPTATGLTFTSQKSNATANTCATQLATAVAGSAGSSAVSMTSSDSTLKWGFGVWVWRNSGGVGNSVEQHTATLTASLTPTAADSGIVWATFDFAAAALQTIVPTPTDIRQDVVIGTNYTIYVSDLTNQTSAGAVAYGISGTGSGPFSIVALEVKGTAGGGAAAAGANKRKKLEQLDERR